MAIASVTKLQNRLASIQASARNSKMKRKAGEVRDAAVGAGAAYVFGSIESRGVPMPTVAGIDAKITWAVILGVVGASMKGTAGDVATASAEGLLAAYAYQQGRGDGMAVRGAAGF